MHPENCTCTECRKMEGCDICDRTWPSASMSTADGDGRLCPPCTGLDVDAFDAAEMFETAETLATYAHDLKAEAAKLGKEWLALDELRREARATFKEIRAALTEYDERTGAKEG